MSNFDRETWLKLFPSYCFESRTLATIPESFLKYLRADGIVLAGEIPESCLSDYSSDEESEEALVRPDEVFSEFHRLILNAIKDLGGKIVPKLGNLSPKDGIWISTEGNMACYNPNDLYQLLKASDRISLCAPSSPSPSLHLVKWEDLEPSMEFRVFIKNRKIIGCCQRNDTQYFDFLAAKSDQIKSALRKFVNQTILPSFDEPSFVLDLYIGELKMIDVRIIDISQFGPDHNSSSLLTWEELESIHPSNEFPIKLIESDADCRLGCLRTKLGPCEFENPSAFGLEGKSLLL